MLFDQTLIFLQMKHWMYAADETLKKFFDWNNDEIISRDIKRTFFHAAVFIRTELCAPASSLPLFKGGSLQRDSDVVITPRVHRRVPWGEIGAWINFSRLARRRFSFWDIIFRLHSHPARSMTERKRDPPRDDSALFALFFLREEGAKRVHWVAETVSSLLPRPANLIPCPYVPRIANEPSTWPITGHCGTSKTLSPHRTTISASLFPHHSLLLAHRSSPFAFLAKPPE